MRNEYTNYDEILININQLIDFLDTFEVFAKFRSHLENDYLIAQEFVKKVNIKEPNNVSDVEGRSALGGLHELYKMIWSVKDCEDFHKIIPHLNLLKESATRINAVVPMISPVTGKQDDSSNKLIETIIAMFAIAFGSDVDLDDPVKSSNGLNPDILLTYKGKRIAIACKTLRGSSEQTILSNIQSAAKQIERAECDYGYIVINTMNILPHDLINNNIYDNIQVPAKIITAELHNKIKQLKSTANDEISELFNNSPKTSPVISYFVHSTTKMPNPFSEPNSAPSYVATMLKSIVVDEIITTPNFNNDIEFLDLLNNFIHHKL